MHKLAQLSDDERKRIVADFLEEAFDGLDMEPGFAERMRSATPSLPDEPTPEQVDAWIELAELVQDPAFKASIRRMSEQHSAARQSGEEMKPDPNWQAAAAQVAERGGAALDAGVAPGSPEAEAVVAELLPAFGAPGRAELADKLADRHRRPRRALLAAAGDHQRLAADPDHGSRLGVVHRRATQLIWPERRRSPRSRPAYAGRAGRARASTPRGGRSRRPRRGHGRPPPSRRRR